MKQVDKINMSVITRFPESAKRELFDRFGCEGDCANFTIDGEYNNNLIDSIGKYCSMYCGNITVYKMWYCKAIECWRLVFGYN